MSDVEPLPHATKGKPKPPNYTPEEDAIVMEDWKAQVPVEQTAQKINRTWGSVRQRLLKLKHDQGLMTRSGRVTRAFRWAPDDLKAVYRKEGTDAFMLALDEYAKAETARVTALQGQALAEAQAKKTALIAEIAAQPMTRKERICALRNSGMTLDEVGKQFDITRERVRQITTPNYQPSYKKTGSSRTRPVRGRPPKRDLVAKFDDIQEWIKNLRARETSLEGEQVSIMLKLYDKLSEGQQQAFRRMLGQRKHANE